MGRVWVPVAAVLVLALSACGDGGGRDRTVVVFAAASLTDAFEEVAAGFEAAQEDVEVELNLAGSPTLREQIREGAPADVFASADEANMAALVAEGQIAGGVRVFATNLLQIAVPAGNPGRISGLEDFADEGLLLGLCAEGVPCGDLARRVLAHAGVRPAVDTEEPDVRSLLTKLGAGELDGGMVYVTDVVAAGADVAGVPIPSEHNPPARYPIALLDEGADPRAAEAFVAFVLGGEGQAILAAHGFGTP